MIYNGQQSDWPDFTYDLRDIENAIFDFPEQTGHVSGILKAILKIFNWKP